MKIELNLAPNFFNIGDSMCFDSGTTIMSADICIENIADVQIDLRACGHVKVDFCDDVYKCASNFPTELMELFESGLVDTDERVYIHENNWWEVFIDVYPHEDWWKTFIDVYPHGEDDCNSDSVLFEGVPSDFENEEQVKEYIVELLKDMEII
jgi:hypothetical protein